MMELPPVVPLPMTEPIARRTRSSKAKFRAVAKGFAKGRAAAALAMASMANAFTQLIVIDVEAYRVDADLTIVDMEIDFSCK